MDCGPDSRVKFMLQRRTVIAGVVLLGFLAWRFGSRSRPGHVPMPPGAGKAGLLLSLASFFRASWGSD